MLRDLRITTAKVESRRGDEQVTLLGELAVDERAYAEVGVPVRRAGASGCSPALATASDADQALARAAVAGGRTARDRTTSPPSPT